MSSIIPGYNYDIFISYRQKDNKHDGWVTEFVHNLKDELESTFKEEISVYFDVNPHDGLLETYDVDASLREKLKCIIFIPIISRTYCDPRSFAWEHEFKAFVEMASKDQLGLKIKLPNGNVASRVLPVRIHDLDETDIKDCETLLGSVLRGIEFIYREPGINKPLKADDDENKNLNRTKYSYQVNKVANSVKEILVSIRHPEQSAAEKSFKDEIFIIPSKKTNTRKVIALSAFAALLFFIAGFFLFRGHVNQKPAPEKSIAVLPFINNSPDRENSDYIVNGLLDEIINNLQQIKSFSRVLPRNSVEKYRLTMKSAPDIAKELNVNYILSGSAQKIGDKLNMRITLTDARKNTIIKSYPFSERIENPDQIFNIYSRVSQSVAADLKAEITPAEKEHIEKKPTKILTAFDFYQRGKAEEAYFNMDPGNSSLMRAKTMYRKALSYDSTFAAAYAGLAMVNAYESYNKEYNSHSFLDSCLILINKALSLDDKMAEAYWLKGVYYLNVGDPESALNEFDICLKFNPNYWQAYNSKAIWIYGVTCKNADYIEAIVNIEKAISLNHGKERTELMRNLGTIFAAGAGFNDLAIRVCEEALSIDNDSLSYFSSMAGLTSDPEKKENYLRNLVALRPNDIIAVTNLVDLLIQKGDLKTALQYNVRFADWIKNTKPFAPGAMHRIGYTFWLNGNKQEAYFWFRKQKKFDLTTIENNRYSTPTSYYDLACVYAFEGKKDSAYINLGKLEEMKVFPAWWVSLMKTDPLLENLRKDREFQELVSRLESKYQAEHERVKKWLVENDKL